MAACSTLRSNFSRCCAGTPRRTMSSAHIVPVQVGAASVPLAGHAIVEVMPLLLSSARTCACEHSVHTSPCAAPGVQGPKAQPPPSARVLSHRPPHTTAKAAFGLSSAQMAHVSCAAAAAALGTKQTITNPPWLRPSYTQVGARASKDRALCAAIQTCAGLAARTWRGVASKAMRRPGALSVRSAPSSPRSRSYHS